MHPQHRWLQNLGHKLSKPSVSGRATGKNGQVFFEIIGIQHLHKSTTSNYIVVLSGSNDVHQMGKRYQLEFRFRNLETHVHDQIMRVPNRAGKFK